MKEKKGSNKKINNKKAQIAIFIIIAIVIVVIIVLLSFFLRRGTTENIESEAAKLNLVSPQVRPVYIYMDDYLKEIVEDGLEILRLQGGYIYLPLTTELVEVKTIGRHVKHVNNNIELIEGTGTTKVPLWVGKDKIMVPTLPFMAEQLELYIKDEFSKIIFTEFENQGMQISQGPIDVSVFLAEEVRINVDSPTSMDFRGQTFTFEEFEQTVQINFNELYDVLSTLVSYELSENYLEDHVQSLISLYSYTGGDKRDLSLPPKYFTDTNIDGKFVTWVPQEVKEDLSFIFSENFRLLKMDKTNFDRLVINDPLAQGVFDSFVYDYFPTMNNIHIDFEYNPANDIEFRTNPSNLVPDRNSQPRIPFLPSFTVFSYEFAYTIATPIITRVSDDNSAKFTAEGYEFYFPMKLYICNNRERECATIPNYHLNIVTLGSLTTQNFYDCQNVSSQKTITVTDINTNEPLEETDITHYCDGYINNCWLGGTDNEGKVVINLPKCSNSTLELNKNEYQTIRDTVKDSYVLERIKDYNLEVMLVRANDFASALFLTDKFTTDSCGRTPSALLEASFFRPNVNDKIMFVISNKNGANTAFASYPLDDKIAFAGGDYIINTIVQSEVEIQPSYFAGQYVSFNTEDNEAPYIGDWVLGTSEDEFIINPSELQGKDTVVFYVLVDHLSTEELSVESMQSVLVNSAGIFGDIQTDSDCDGVDEIVTINIPKSEYANFIKPRFIKKI